MPPFTAPVMEATTTVATSGGLFATSSFMKIAATALVAVTIGFVSGYFFTEKQTTELAVVQPSSNTLALHSSAPVSSQSSEVKHNTRVQERNSVQHSHMLADISQSVSSSEAPLFQDQFAATNADMTVARKSIEEHPITATIPELPVIIPAAAMIREPNGAQVARPHFWDDNEKPAHREPNILDRLEFSVHEGLGKQFPNSLATNVSMPYFTNSDVTVKYMIVPELWIGAGAGYANMNQKHLTVTLTHPSDPTAGEEVGYEYVHEKTGWAGGLVEYRLPISSRTSLALNAGVAASSLGAIYSSELGARFEMTDHVGVLSGIRLSEVGSNAAKQLADIRNSGTSKLAIDDGADKETPNYNIEASLGFYFRF
jgi:hypothetical protein